MVLHSATEILKAIASVEDPKIVITTHHKPDADAMGSSLGLKLFLFNWSFKLKKLKQYLLKLPEYILCFLSIRLKSPQINWRLLFLFFCF